MCHNFYPDLHGQNIVHLREVQEASRGINVVQGDGTEGSCGKAAMSSVEELYILALHGWSFFS